MRLTNNIQEDKINARKKALQLQKKSPDINNLEGFRINSKTEIFFKKGTPVEKIKETLAKYIRSTINVSEDLYFPGEFIRSNRRHTND